MNDKMIKKPSFKAGMYLLENLTSGMYTDPLAIIREYIQNGVDSIDLSSKGVKQLEIRIELDPIERRITIWDNGIGIPAKFAEDILSSIGSSNKTDPRLRGFRGIGRLGGIALSGKAVFRTKAKNEKIESIQEWDCANLKKLIEEHRNDSLSFNQLFQLITSFRQNNTKTPEESYFEVTLHGVSSFRNYIFDIARVRRYLSQVAPVPFHPDFSHGLKIDEYLKRNLNHHRTYNIFLNDDQIYKPYRDRVRRTKGGFDNIEAINFIEIRKTKEDVIAWGWHGQRDQMLGSIIKGDDSSGMRVRVGNILLGDEHLLDKCFREARFNSYVVGEIHVDHRGLIPNSRRDDFVDNQIKDLFYNGVEREVGIPISKDIRNRSRINSKKINYEKPQSDINKTEMSEVCSIESSDDNLYAKFTDGSINHEKGNYTLKYQTTADQLLINLHQNSTKIMADMFKICCNGCPKSKIILDIISRISN